jgi:alcohol dehydrogenase (NADP+)
MIDTEDPVIIAIAQRPGVHPAVVCVMWAVRRCQVPIPFTTRRANDLANLRGAVDNRFNDDDMAAIDRNGRPIQGQVFLWKEDQRWEDLWDVNCVMTSP